MAELNENFYSSKTHKYPPSSFLVLLGNSNCGMQQKQYFYFLLGICNAYCSNTFVIKKKNIFPLKIIFVPCTYTFEF